MQQQQQQQQHENNNNNIIWTKTNNTTAAAIWLTMHCVNNNNNNNNNNNMNSNTKSTVTDCFFFWRRMETLWIKGSSLGLELKQTTHDRQVAGSIPARVEKILLFYQRMLHSRRTITSQVARSRGLLSWLMQPMTSCLTLNRLQSLMILCKKKTIIYQT